MYFFKNKNLLLKYGLKYNFINYCFNIIKIGSFIIYIKFKLLEKNNIYKIYNIIKYIYIIYLQKINVFLIYI